MYNSIYIHNCPKLLNLSFVFYSFNFLHNPYNFPWFSQDVSGAVSDPSKKGAVGPLSSSSRSDGVHPEGLSATGQGEAEEGDLSRKDKVNLAFVCLSFELNMSSGLMLSLVLNKYYNSFLL